MTTGPLTDLLARRYALVLDGAMGTELHRLGVETDLPLWSALALMSHPETVLQIHREYVIAGADILTANTFRTTPRTFTKAGQQERSEALTALAVALARKAAEEVPERAVLVAGSIAPLEDCYRPDLVPSDDELQGEHELHAARLARAGVDFILLETMGTIREARAALTAARETGNEAVLSFICREDGCLLSGEPLDDAVRAVAPLEPTILSVNCVPVTQINPALAALSAAWPGPWGVYANAGRPEDRASGVITTAVHPEEYREEARHWIAMGARLIGGCCGTNPAHIGAVRSLLPLPETP